MTLKRFEADGLEGEVRFHHVTPELRIMEARRCAYQWAVFHETYTFGLVLRVENDVPVVWKYNHRLYTVDQSHVMLIQPGELHANPGKTPPADFMVVHVAEPLMERVARQLGWPHATLNVNHPHPGTDHPMVRRSLRRFHETLCRELFDDGPGGGVCACWRTVDRHFENLAGLAAALIQNCVEDKRELARPERGAVPIQRALEYLYQHYDEPYSLPALAQAVGCSEFHLVHIFSEEMGVTPSDFKNKVLVAKTCEVLAAFPDRSLESVAVEVGWPGRPTSETRAEIGRSRLLIRHFRRTMGTTPARFRAALKEMPRAERMRSLAPILE